MNATQTQYETAHRRLGAVIDATAATSWDSPSPCEGWTARDVVRHLIQTQRSFLGDRGLALGPASDVDANPPGAWHSHAEQVIELLADDDVPASPFDGFFGPTTVGATLEQFYVWDMIVHRWDIARAVGGDPALSDEELIRMEAGATSFGDAIYMDGVCRPGVEAPAGADREAQVLARLGRVA